MAVFKAHRVTIRGQLNGTLIGFRRTITNLTPDQRDCLNTDIELARYTTADIIKKDHKLIDALVDQGGIKIRVFGVVFPDRNPIFYTAEFLTSSVDNMIDSALESSDENLRVALSMKPIQRERFPNLSDEEFRLTQITWEGARRRALARNLPGIDPATIVLPSEPKKPKPKS